MKMTISGYAWARRHKRDFSAVITIEDPHTRFGLRFHRNPHPAHLVLQFVDLDRPLPAPYDQAEQYRMASVQQIESALEFAREHREADMLTHCQVGIARSPALVLGILMDRLGDEAAAYSYLETIRPEAVPNQHVLALVDYILGSNLLSYLERWDSRNRWSLLRRKLCRRAYFEEARIPLEPELNNLDPMEMMK